MKKSVYQTRKAAGQCVRSGCKRKPKLGKDGKPRSYCPFHNAQNRKHADAWAARQQKPSKPVRAKRVQVTTPATEA